MIHLVILFNPWPFFGVKAEEEEPLCEGSGGATSNAVISFCLYLCYWELLEID